MAYGANNYPLSFDVPAFNAAGIAPAMGNIAFLFLSHIVALPMAQSLKGDLARPTRYHKVVWSSFIIITLANLLFGMLLRSKGDIAKRSPRREQCPLTLGPFHAAFG